MERDKTLYSYVPGQASNPDPLDPESKALTMRPLRLYIPVGVG